MRRARRSRCSRRRSSTRSCTHRSRSCANPRARARAAHGWSSSTSSSALAGNDGESGARPGRALLRPPMECGDLADPATMPKLGTRGSPLALAQARIVAARLRTLGTEVEVVPMRTEGDRLLDAHLATVGGKGLFVTEIEEALLGGALDLAVHSLKDLPAELPVGLTLAAFAERDDPRDVLVTRSGVDFEDLPAGAVGGTSSPRRRAPPLAARPPPRRPPHPGNMYHT